MGAGGRAGEQQSGSGRHRSDACTAGRERQQDQPRAWLRRQAVAFHLRCHLYPGTQAEAEFHD